MDIRIKRTGRILWEFPDVVAIALVEMFPDQAESVKVSYQERLSLLEAERQKGKPANNAGLVPTFDVVHDRVAGTYRLRLTTGSIEEYYTGPPIHAAAAFGGGSRTPPQAVINEYALFVGDGKPVDHAAIAERQRIERERNTIKQQAWPQYK